MSSSIINETHCGAYKMISLCLVSPLYCYFLRPVVCCLYQLSSRGFSIIKIKKKLHWTQKMKKIWKIKTLSEPHFHAFLSLSLHKIVVFADIYRIAMLRSKVPHSKRRECVFKVKS